MRTPVHVCLDQAVIKNLPAGKEHDLPTLERELQKVVEELRTIVPNAIFKLIPIAHTACMQASDEEIQTLEDYLKKNPDKGSIERDDPQAVRQTRH